MKKERLRYETMEQAYINEKEQGLHPEMSVHKSKKRRTMSERYTMREVEKSVDKGA